MDALPLPVDPLGWESATSYLERVAEANHLPLRAVVRALSNGRSVDAWRDEDWRRFAMLTGRSEQQLRLLRRRTGHAPTQHLLVGQPISAIHLIRRRQRVCPSCVGENAALSVIWDVAQVTACPSHRIRLVERCACGRTLTDGGRGPSARSCYCGKRFSDLPSVEALEEEINVSSWIHGALANRAAHSVSETRVHQSAPGPFGNLELHDLLVCIDQIGRTAIHIGTAGPLGTPHPANVGRLCDLYLEDVRDVAAAACRIMSNWPGAYHDLLDIHADVNRDLVAAPHRFSHRGKPARLFKSLLNGAPVRPARDANGSRMPLLVEAMDAWCISRMAGPRKVQRTAGERIVADPVVRTRVADQIGATLNIAFTRRYRRAALAITTSGDVPEDFEETVVATLRREMSVREMLNVLDDRVLNSFRHWIHPRLLRPLSGTTDRRALRFRAEDVLALRSRLTSRVIVDDPAGSAGHVSLRTNGLPFYADWYTKTDLILDILDGHIEPIARKADALLLDMFVDLGKVTRLEISSRIRHGASHAPFQHQGRLIRLMMAIWPEVPPLDLTAARKLGLVRTIQVDNLTGGRRRPAYRYHIGSALNLHMDLVGKTGSERLDLAIRSSD